MTIAAPPDASAPPPESGGPSGTLEIRGMTKSFPNVQALQDVSIDVRPGEILALMGENGAGKSTLLKILSGDYQPDEGTMTRDGEQLSFGSPRDAIRAGHPGHLPGARDHPGRRRRREHLRRRAPDARPVRGPQADGQAGCRRPAALRLRGRPADEPDGRHALVGSAPAGRDHAGAQVRRPAPRPRRTDLVAHRRGGGAPVHARSPAARRGCRDHLREPPDPRDPAPRPPRRGDARREAGRSPRGQ